MPRRAGGPCPARLHYPRCDTQLPAGTQVMTTSLQPIQFAPASLTLAAHSSPMGELLSFWTPRGLHRISWNAPPPDREAYEPAAQSGGELRERIAAFDDAVTAYFRGDCGLFDAVEIDCSRWPPFFAAVYRICRAIPAGQTLTYGELAARAGSPRAARAVGQAMATNRLILVIPCHRVVASGGRLGGYGGPGGLDTKRWLLDHERAKGHKRADRHEPANGHQRINGKLRSPAALPLG